MTEKRKYEKPSQRVIELQHRTHLLQASSYETTGTGRTSINMMDEEEDL